MIDSICLKFVCTSSIQKHELARLKLPINQFLKHAPALIKDSMHFVLCFPASRGLFFLRMRWVEYQNTRILGGKARVIKIEGVVLNRVVYFRIA